MRIHTADEKKKNQKKARDNNIIFIERMCERGAHRVVHFIFRETIQIDIINKMNGWMDGWIGANIRCRMYIQKPKRNVVKKDKITIIYMTNNEIHVHKIHKHTNKDGKKKI